jgi:predicted anti-sigma-YlaC factor YlaD
VTCQEIADFLMDYLDGTLSGTQRAIFEEHLGECPACVAYLKSYQTTVRLSKVTRAEGLDNAPEDLIQAILAARKQR